MIILTDDLNSINILIDIINNNNDDVINTKNITRYIEGLIHGNVDITLDVENIQISKDKYEANKEIINKIMNKYSNIELSVY